MKRVQLAGLFVLVFACAVQAQPVSTTFSYFQTDATTGSGTIAGFVYHDVGGDITFAPTPMPAALVINPATGEFVGQQTVQAGNSNEANTAIGLVWSGSVTAHGTRGSDNYTIQIPLKFVPKVTQVPDSNDYNWNVLPGDDFNHGSDTVTSANIRFAMWLSRDDVIDAAETPNTFQRYTQTTLGFVAGPDFFQNTDTTTPAIKDAMDSGNPAGNDAVGRDLAFYYGWRDTGGLSSGAVLVEDFAVGGLLNADTTTLVPEPGSLLSLGVIAMVGMIRRPRKA